MHVSMEYCSLVAIWVEWGSSRAQFIIDRFRVERVSFSLLRSSFVSKDGKSKHVVSDAALTISQRKTPWSAGRKRKSGTCEQWSARLSGSHSWCILGSVVQWSLTPLLQSLGEEMLPCSVSICGEETCPLDLSDWPGWENKLKYSKQSNWETGTK